MMHDQLGAAKGKPQAWAPISTATEVKNAAAGDRCRILALGRMRAGTDAMGEAS